MVELPLTFDPRTEEEHLADAERFDLWAERAAVNGRVSKSFRELAAQSRGLASIAKRRSCDSGPG